MAAIKFNTLTFDVKDLLLICGLVAGYFRFEQKQTDMYNDLKAQIKKIVSDNKIQEVKFNARFDMLNKPTSQKETEKETLFNFVAICHENRLEKVRKRLVKFRLV